MLSVLSLGLLRMAINKAHLLNSSSTRDGSMAQYLLAWVCLKVKSRPGVPAGMKVYHKHKILSSRRKTWCSSVGLLLLISIVGKLSLTNGAKPFQWSWGVHRTSLPFPDYNLGIVSSSSGEPSVQTSGAAGWGTGRFAFHLRTKPLQLMVCWTTTIFTFSFFGGKPAFRDRYLYTYINIYNSLFISRALSLLGFP